MTLLKKISRFALLSGILAVTAYLIILVLGICIYFIAIHSFQYNILTLSKANTTCLVDNAQMVLFPNLKGPRPPSKILKSKADTWMRYHTNSTNSFAVYLTDASSDFLGLVHAFHTFGIPVSLHINLKEALQHKVVLLYPIVTENNLPADKMRLIQDFVIQGGTVIGTNVVGVNKSHFGIKYNKLAQNRFSAFICAKSDTLMQQFKLPEEQKLSFGNKKDYKSIFESYGYKPTTATPLIQFEDSSALLTRLLKGKGQVFAMGLDLGEFFSRCQNSRGFNGGRTYVNGYEPSMDVIMRLLKQIYFMQESAPVCLGTVPFGKACTILLTHDIDYSLSIENAVGYAQMEQKKGIRATYFIQTKYIRDWNDNCFFNNKGIECLKKIVACNMEIASHSVSHSRVFSEFNLGTGKESYPEYRPFVKEKRLTMNGSILGELRVSKYLLEYFLPGTKVTSFRAGHLSNPYALPEALVACNYLNSSNETANNSLTHLPFQVNYNRGFNQEVPIFEYPVTIEDEEKPGLGRRLASAKFLINKISTYGGLVCILIHTDCYGEKLKFEQDIIDAYKDKGYFTTLKDFNAWWTLRNEIKTTVHKYNNTIQLELQSKAKIEGLCIEIPANWQLQPSRILTSQKGNTLLLPGFAGTLKLNFKQVQ
jgi:hypothetical protein